jgi:hypothetical protein
VGTRTDAAQARVVAARADFEGEVDRLEAAGRAAVDIPARVRKAPAKAAGVAAGAAFLALGGPKRLFRRAKRAVTGKEEELPSELLPKEIEKALGKLGDDGKKVRGTIEREFARYLDDRAKERKKEGILAAGVALASNALRPISIRAGKTLVERMMNPDGPGFEEQLERLRARRRGEGSGDDVGGTDLGGPRGGAGL